MDMNDRELVDMFSNISASFLENDSFEKDRFIKRKPVKACVIVSGTVLAAAITTATVILTIKKKKFKIA